jgi:short-subunit dehydrogenase
LYLSGRNAQALTQTKHLCEEKGATVFTHAFDISDLAALQHYASSISCPIDLIIANAGVSGGNRIDGTPESIDTITTLIDVNLKAPIQLTRLFLPQLISQGHGRLVYISSVQALRGMPQSPTYCATKSGIKAYTEGLRAWLRPHNINVTLVFPGFVKTAMSDRLDCPKPFMISADGAAMYIKRKIDHNTPIIAIPKIHYYAVKLLQWLPLKWADWGLQHSKVDVPEPR